MKHRGSTIGVCFIKTCKPRRSMRTGFLRITIRSHKFPCWELKILETSADWFFSLSESLRVPVRGN